MASNNSSVNSGRWIVACLSAGNGAVYDGGKLIHQFQRLIGGRKGFETPTGDFHGVWRKDAMHVSTIYHAPMHYPVYFQGGKAFHQGSVHHASHGCIHLAEADAHWLYDWVAHHEDQTNVRIEP